MSSLCAKTMRDALIEQVYHRMYNNDDIFFVSADLGAPAIDKLRVDFKDRFVNVGIAEQNLINVCTGLALEGFTVYAYAIASFLTMRAYEQIRTNLALSSQHRQINVNLVGVGAGVSYDMSGPSHHCMEDIGIIRMLPNIVLCSPSDWLTAKQFVDFSLDLNKPKYIRLESKPLTQVYGDNATIDWDKGFCELVEGDDVCIVSTGYMTHEALKAAREVRRNGNVGVVDVFLLKPINEDVFLDTLKKYRFVITIEEAFTNKGGLDCLVANLLNHSGANIKLKSLGFEDKYLFISGGRDFLYELSHFGLKDIKRVINDALQDRTIHGINRFNC